MDTTTVEHEAGYCKVAWTPESKACVCWSLTACGTGGTKPVTGVCSFYSEGSPLVGWVWWQSGPLEAVSPAAGLGQGMLLATQTSLPPVEKKHGLIKSSIPTIGP